MYYTGYEIVCMYPKYLALGSDVYVESVMVFFLLKDLYLVLQGSKSMKVNY